MTHVQTPAGDPHSTALASRAMTHAQTPTGDPQGWRHNKTHVQTPTGDPQGWRHNNTSSQRWQEIVQLRSNQSQNLKSD